MLASIKAFFVSVYNTVVKAVTIAATSLVKVPMDIINFVSRGFNGLHAMVTGNFLEGFVEFFTNTLYVLRIVVNPIAGVIALWIVNIYFAYRPVAPSFKFTVKL